MTCLEFNLTLLTNGGMQKPDKFPADLTLVQPGRL